MLPDWISATILGIVEGVTEFLPISSTGHLIITKELLGFDFTPAFEIVIQGGAIFSVLIYYFKDLLTQGRSLSSSKQVQQFWLNVIIAVIPAVIVGLAFGDYIEKYLLNPFTVAVSLIVGGVILWWVESIPKTVTTQTAQNISRKQALVIGVAQLIAMIPGVSRSGTTIVSGLLLGLSRSAATNFSFYLSIPTLLGATVLSGYKHRAEIMQEGVGTLIIGIGVSFVVALLVIHWLLQYISKNDFKGFAIYRIVAGLVLLALFYSGVISA